MSPAYRNRVDAYFLYHISCLVTLILAWGECCLEAGWIPCLQVYGGNDTGMINDANITVAQEDEENTILP